MVSFFTVLHIIVTIAMIFIVLIQTGRGSEIGAVFGSGASQTLFGSSGPTGFMTKLTTIAAILFMLTSLSLAYFYSHREYVVKTVPSAEKVDEKAGQSLPK